MQNQDSRLRAAVATGDAELDRGEGVAYTQALLESMTQTALREMNCDSAIDPGVIA